MISSSVCAGSSGVSGLPLFPDSLIMVSGILDRALSRTTTLCCSAFTQIVRYPPSAITIDPVT